jgi:carbon-monoxide dehydrogenase large subunit
MLNPMVVDGQQHGGVAHGIGNALLEEACYDADGQFTSASFLDYLLPTADDVPPITVVHQSHPSPLNPLGVKAPVKAERHHPQQQYSTRSLMRSGRCASNWARSR